jgi:N-acetylglucosaminyl-diphospho-decaprenol L-rhamnosyltransferase
MSLTSPRTPPRSAPGPRVDVVVPVYNAPEATLSCLESLYKHSGTHLNRVLVEDDGSEPDVAHTLDGLALPGLCVGHAPENTGFGRTVNRGMARVHTDLALVLNSDIRADEDFIAPLLDAMNACPDLVALQATSPQVASYDLSRYRRRAGCVVTYSLWGYAFVIRRAAFAALDGFDSAYGRGYFEDVDLGRRLIARGGWIGVHPEARVEHQGGASFAAVPDRRTIAERARAVYLERHPIARRRLQLWSATGCFSRLPPDLQSALEDFLARGGRVEWMCGEPGSDLPGLPMQSRRFALGKATEDVLARHHRRPDRNISDLWWVDDLGAAERALVKLAKLRGIAVRSWKSAA